MSEINFDALERTTIEILTLHQAAIMKHGVGNIAYELKKSDKTIYAELNPSNLLTYLETVKKYDDNHKKPSSLPKLGLVDFIMGMIKSDDLSPLIAINTFFNMACYEIPRTDLDKADILDLLQDINKEHFENGREVLEALKDNRLKPDEAASISKEAMDLINATSVLKHVADDRVKRG